MGRRTRLCSCPQRCGGGLVQDRTFFGRPQFTCTKCGHQFTSGKTGEPWASVVPFKAPEPMASEGDRG